MLLDSADAFGEQVARYRSELLVHCYRMLGNIEEAEDAVQETLGRAWQGRETFRRSISFRAWLYRIATNVCLNAIEVRKRDRVEPLPAGPGSDSLMASLAESDTGPEARYESHESVSLAFLTVLHLLSPRQRAVLLLRDVLSFSAVEVAALLDMSVPAVTSALQRARSTLRSSYTPRGRSPATTTTGRPHARNLLARFIRAWEAADVAGLVALLREDAVLGMPPKPAVVGARAIGDFLAASIFPIAPMRLVEGHANGSPALAAYMREPSGNRSALFALLVIAADSQEIRHIDAFSDPGWLARFGVPVEIWG